MWGVICRWTDLGDEGRLSGCFPGFLPLARQPDRPQYLPRVSHSQLTKLTKLPPEWGSSTSWAPACCVSQQMDIWGSQPAVCPSRQTSGVQGLLCVPAAFWTLPPFSEELEQGTIPSLRLSSLLWKIGA